MNSTPVYHIAPVVSEIHRIDGPLGHHYEAHFEGMNDFHIQFIPPELEDGSLWNDDYISSCLRLDDDQNICLDDYTGDELDAFQDALAIPSVSKMIKDADERRNVEIAAEKQKADDAYDAEYPESLKPSRYSLRADGVIIESTDAKLLERK